MGEVPATVTWGLLAAWAVHDAEELATMAAWMRENRAQLEERFPRVPWGRFELSQKQVNVAIGLMAGVIAGAAADGARTGGRSPVFQSVLAGFGLHGLVHLAQAAIVRGYTPGVVTSPLMVLPFSVWAWRRLKAAGVPVRGSAAGLMAFPAVVGGVHALARLATRPRKARVSGRWF
ncbi:HXXEE domain-containing protein [Nonomuraea typhae]|uniref:HXXEE domain-containing protein n=1 Tax=Nonomuraea typhae TaxID=2603600 RepID=UPI0015E1BF52|nr:HXXEE domain-containing protein [Nonomuraea typhae]